MRTAHARVEADDPANILIVDDRPENLQAFEATLEGLNQRIVLASSGPEALRFLLHHEVAVVLLDVQMPGMDGFETMQLIRQRETAKTIPIIFVTALNTANEHIRRGYALGAVDYIIKPVVPEILIAKVSMFVELHHSRNAQVRIQLLEEELEAERKMVAWLTQFFPETRPENLIEVPEVERTWEGSYRKLLQDYVHAASGAGDFPHDTVRGLAEEIARHDGGAKQVITLHTHGTQTVQTHALPRQARFLLDQCRILSLELMGHLADHYRRKATERAGRGDLARPALPSPPSPDEDRVPSESTDED